MRFCISRVRFVVSSSSAGEIGIRGSSVGRRISHLGEVDKTKLVREIERDQYFYISFSSVSKDNCVSILHIFTVSTCGSAALLSHSSLGLESMSWPRWHS